MTKPVILAVDDDRQVLSAIERDLRQKYRDDYRVVAAQSGEQALEAARELKRRGTPIALFVVDQRMPDMTGTEFLNEARTLHPDAQAHAPHGVRRLGGRDCRDQRRRPRLLPDEAVGSAGALPVSGARRASRGLGGARQDVVRGRARHRIALVAPELRDARLPLTQPDPVSVDRRRARRRDARDRGDGQWRKPRAAARRAAGGWHHARRARARGAGGEDRPADRADAAVLRPGDRRRGPGRPRLRGVRSV